MKREKMILIIAGVCFVVCFLLIFGLLSGSKGEAEVYPVVLALNDIEAGTKIEAEHVQLSAPLKGVDVKVFYVNIEEVVGLTINENVPKGKALRKTFFNTSDDAFAQLPIPDGMLALTLSVDDIEQMPGFLQPGNYVDVMGYKARTAERLSAIVLSSKVLSIELDKEEANAAMTIAVTSGEAEIISSSLDRGKIRLILRPQPLEKKNASYIPGTMYVIRGNIPPQVVSMSVNNSEKAAGGDEKKKGFSLNFGGKDKEGVE